MRAGISALWVRRTETGTVILTFLAMLIVGSLPGRSVQASEPMHSEPIKRLYVDSFEGKFGSAELRQRVIARLNADHTWQLVDKPTEADAVVRGSGEIWVKGHFSNSPHAKSSTREPVYGGYLSLEVKDKRGEILWSYLVTPGRIHWHGVDQDMADHIVRVMDEALAGGNLFHPRPAQTNANQLSIAGAGSTFAAPLYQKWIESFEDARPDLRASYQAVGSEAGIEELKDSRTDFAASDVPLTDEQMTSTQLRVDQYATVLGGVVVAYNLGGVGHDLRFTPEALADIYIGKITRWNDRRLRAINRGANLPDEPIVVVHRSDGSGTSFAWTEFLSKTSTEWKNSVGTGMKVTWPTGEEAEGNEGVASKVGRTPGAIGYMELTYALRHQLSFGLVRNAAGSFIQANLTTLAAAARSLPRTGKLRESLIDPAGKDAYPIATFTWILISQSVQGAQKVSALHDLVRWMLTSGQKECAGLGYLPLPKEVAEAELRQLGPSAR